MHVFLVWNEVKICWYFYTVWSYKHLEQHEKTTMYDVEYWYSTKTKKLQKGSMYEPPRIQDFLKKFLACLQKMGD